MISKLFLAASLAAAVTAQEVLYTFPFFKESNCGGDTMDLKFFEHSGDTCRGGTMIPGDGWEKRDNGDWKAYVNAKGLASNCQVALLKESSVDPESCGDVFATFDGATTTPCSQLWVPQQIGAFWCCDDECDGIIAFEATARLARKDYIHMSSPASNLANKVKKSSPSSDVTAIKRSPLMRPRADCKWEGAAPEDSRGAAVKVTGTLSCGQDGDCQLQDQAEVSFEATQSFGVSTEVGASFFDLVQASVSFSYEYSFTQGEKRLVSYTVSIPPGTKGHLEWTPYLECTTGKFTGDCQWAAEADGFACVHKQLASGQPDGLMAYVQEF
ncbi:hypothetical protein GE09DRAFT_1225590 [Coniochaeta sp. 2T2.1]|nr:hypothetical protein GE09DRAFT_1225590 [Coniochaeta sp. 2T2.1]